MTEIPIPSRRQFLKGLGGVGLGAGTAWLVTRNTSGVGHTYVDMTDVPEKWMKDGRVLFRFKEGFYWFDPQEKTFEVAEVDNV